MSIDSPVVPVRKRKCAWLDNMAQAWHEVWVAGNNSPRRFHRLSRSLLSSKIFRRSIPRIITWWSTPGASNRANLGICISYHITFTTSTYLFSYDRPSIPAMTVPQFPLSIRFLESEGCPPFVRAYQLFSSLMNARNSSISACCLLFSLFCRSFSAFNSLTASTSTAVSLV